MHGMAMDDLFSASTRERSFQNAPLAVRMRPNSLDEYVGQQKAVGKGSWLRAAIEHDVLSSVILYGPAGTGKTTLAHIIANHTKSEFVEVSAVTGTVKDLRRVIDEAKTRLNTYDRRTILFIDEIHRFSKSQQDALLHAVENRTVIMIGATTENPYFEVNSALLSRGRVVELEHLKDEDIAMLIERALEAPQGLNGKFSADDDTVKTICTLAAGDARSALTTLELASEIAVTRPDTEGTPAPAAGERYPITVDDAYYPCLYGTYLAMMKGPDWVTELLSDTTGANWSDPAVAQMADDFAAMRANGYFSDSCGSNVFPSAQNGEFAMGTAAMYYNGSWLPNEVHDITGDDFQWGAMFFPAPDNAEYPYTTYSTGCQFFGITKGCEHPEEALALLEEFTSVQTQQDMVDKAQSMPVVDGLELPENLKSAGELQAQSTDVIPWCGMYSSNSDVNAVVNGMFAELLAGSVDGAGFVSGVQSQLQ